MNAAIVKIGIEFENLCVWRSGSFHYRNGFVFPGY